MIMVLVEDGILISISNSHTLIALHYAAYCNKVDAIKLLVKLGADVLVVNNEGQTPLHHLV